MVYDFAILPEEMQQRQNLTYLGYPRTEDYQNELKADKAKYKVYVKSHMVDMSDPNVSQETKDNVEFLLNFTNPLETKLHLNVKRNTTRAKEQEQLRKEIIDREKREGTYDSRIDKNVLILYFDNLSRAHFYRKMPRTAEWLGKFVSGDKDLNAYQYFRYHSVYYNTLWSNNALYYGEIKNLKSTSENAFDSYSNNGYITGFSKDACEMTANAFEPDELDSIKIHRFDHHASSFT